MLDQELNQVQEEQDQDSTNLPDFDDLWNAESLSDVEEGKPAETTDDDVDDDDEEADDDIDNEDGNDDDNQSANNDKTSVNPSTNNDADDFKLSITFNKENIDLNKEDAIKYAQLGMISQKAISQREEYKEKLDKFEAIAKKAGMSLDEFLDNVNEKQNEIEIENELDKLKSKEEYKDLNDDILMEIATLRVNGKKKDSQIEQIEKVDAQKALQQKEISEQVRRFQNAHPEIDVSKLETILTDEMYEMIDKGSTILEAYNTVTEKELREKIKAQEEQIKVNKLNEENRNKSVGNTKSVEGGDGHDPLIDILFSD